MKQLNKISIASQFFLFCLFIFGCTDDDVVSPKVGLCGKPSLNYTKTLVGLHGSSDPKVLAELNAGASRFGFKDYQLRIAFDNDGGQDVINKLKTLHDNGIESITFLTWPEDTISTVGPDYDRVPLGEDRILALELLDKYLEEAGPYIDWVQINQEPFGVTPYREADAEPDPETGLIPALEWWKVVAERICEKRNTDPSLAHLKILSPGISGIKNLVRNDAPDPDFDEQPVLEELIDSLISFGEQYCDAIDLHLHTESLELGIAEIEYIMDRTNMPLGTTEWSQAHVAKSSGWIDAFNSNFGMTNRKVINNAYEDPMSPDEWQSFIADGPQTPGFIPDFYQAMVDRGLLFACYGSVYQYGSLVFDWKMVYAQKTVTPLQKNQPFYDEFTSLTE